MQNPRQLGVAGRKSRALPVRKGGLGLLRDESDDWSGHNDAGRGRETLALMAPVARFDAWGAVGALELNDFSSPRCAQRGEYGIPRGRRRA